MLSAADIRKKYLDFFRGNAHAVIPSASLVPQNDPTTLFTGSGMQPLIPYLLGENHPAGARLANSQKCFRAMDIEEVGDNRHTTFFEMLGNWSLGDYFKQEQLPWFFEFLTDEVGLDPKKLYVTAFIGDEKNGIPRDSESAKLWKTLFAKRNITAETADMGSEENGGIRGIKDNERIFFYDAKKNWWSRSGTPEKMPSGEPGGPDSEVFYCFEEIAHDKQFGEHCHPNCDCGRFLEIGNSVFMEYVKREDGTFGKLPKRNVDFGGGLERIAAAANNDPDIFQIDLFREMIAALEQLSGSAYSDPKKRTSFRVVADHIRAAVFLIADGVVPGNVEREYFVRRLIRRAVRHADKLGIGEGHLAEFVSPILLLYADDYVKPNISEKEIERIILDEETQFRISLNSKDAEKRESELIKEFKLHGHVSGAQGTMIFTTYGIPIEMTVERIKDEGIQLDTQRFLNEHYAEMKKHQDLSRAGAAQKFAGGLADHSEKTVQLHTAHHLLLRALQIVLGPDVHQRGSNITQERLRIDFQHGQKMTEEQKKEVERIVNEKIGEKLPVLRTEMSLEDAERLGAEHEFGAKYPERVSVYSVGPKDATPDYPKFSERYSIEFCGGPHVTNTGDLGRFRILKEEAVAQGIRRIKAVLE